MAFIILSEGGGPHIENGKYILSSHGRVIRELTEAEYHEHQAHVVRGFSGHWMAFSGGALLVLLGKTWELKSRSKPSLDVSAAPTIQEEDDGEVTNSLPETASGREALVGLTFYIGCIYLIRTRYPVLGAVAAIPVTVSAVHALCRQRGFPHRSFESVTGCLSVFPNAWLAATMGWLVAQFIYACVYVGPFVAVTEGMTLVFPQEGPTHLSNGELLNNRVWATLMILVEFPLFGLGTIGLSHFAECVGRYVEVRKPVRQSVDS